MKNLSLILNTSLALLVSGFFYLIFYFHPVGYVYLIDEDSWAEYGTFVFYFFSFLLLSWTILRHQNYRKLGYLILLVFLFFVAMEEISWGQRLFQVGTPYFIAKHNLQVEINVHNLPYLGKLLHTLIISIYFWAIILPLLTKTCKPIREGCQLLSIPLVPVSLWPYFLASLYFYYERFLFRPQEPSELFLSFGFFAYGVTIFNRAKNRKSSKLISASLILMFFITWGLVQFFSNPGQLKWRFHYMASIIYPEMGMEKQAETLFSYIRKNPNLHKPDSFYLHGSLLLKMDKVEKANQILKEGLQKLSLLEKEKTHSSIPSFNKGKIYMLLGENKLAEEKWAIAIQKEKATLEEATNRWQKEKSLMRIVEINLERGEYDKARESLNQVQKLNPNKLTMTKINKLLKRIEK